MADQRKSFRPRRLAFRGRNLPFALIFGVSLILCLASTQALAQSEGLKNGAASLAAGETALAQIYGLHIPIGQLDDDALRRLAAVTQLSKANFNPAEPRIPMTLTVPAWGVAVVENAEPFHCTIVPLALPKPWQWTAVTMFS